MDAKVSSHDSDSERLLVAWMVSPEWSAVQHGLSLTLRELFLSWDPDSVVSREPLLGLQTAACQDLNANCSSSFLGCLPQHGDQGTDGGGHLPGEAGTVGPGVHLLRVFQNVEMLSSMDSASVRVIKPFPAPLTPGRLQSPQPAPAVPPAPLVPVAPKLDHQRMDTIQEDPSMDSHADEDGFEKDPFPNSSTAAKSFEDLTDHPVTRSEKASSFKLQRQNRIDSKETEC